MSAGWREWARCQEIGVDIFFPPPEYLTSSYTAARQVCDRCPVRTPCLDYALAHEADLPRDDRAGIWGGLTPHQRHQLQRPSRAAA